jgi:hypothetical protein
MLKNFKFDIRPMIIGKYKRETAGVIFAFKPYSIIPPSKILINLQYRTFLLQLVTFNVSKLKECVVVLFGSSLAVKVLPVLNEL